MSQSLGGLDRSFLAGDTVSAYHVMQVPTATANTVIPWQTTTAAIVGVTQEAVDSGSAVTVRLLGTTKCIAANSIVSGTILMPQTATGLVLTATTAQITAAARHIVGISLEAGDTNSVIEVLLQPTFIGNIT